EEGFLSYDDLVMSMEGAQLAELSGMTEEQAEEAIAFAEEAAERVEEEQRVAKAATAAEAPAGTIGHGGGTIRPTAAQRAAELFADVPASEEPAAPKPTLDSLFGPETATPAADSATPEPTVDGTATPVEQPASDGGNQ